MPSSLSVPHSTDEDDRKVDEQLLSNLVKALPRMCTIPEGRIPRDSRDCLLKHAMPPVYVPETVQSQSRLELEEEAQRALEGEEAFVQSLKRPREEGGTVSQKRQEVGDTPGTCRSPSTDLVR